MRVLLQRVTQASVSVGGQIVATIGPGLVALVGVGPSDTDDDALALASKTAKLRVFADADGKTNLAIADVPGGAVLVVSQFTLYADTRKGNRPSFIGAAEPGEAQRLVEVYRAALDGLRVTTASGVFGAYMQVSLVNDGPFTILLER